MDNVDYRHQDVDDRANIVLDNEEKPIENKGENKKVHIQSPARKVKETIFILQEFPISPSR